LTGWRIVNRAPVPTLLMCNSAPTWLPPASAPAA
jgi:hypothetical protein